jgi:hypothetical protein
MGIAARTAFPPNFDGARFAKQYGLDPQSPDTRADGFFVEGSWLYYPDRLGTVDLSGCTTPTPLQRLAEEVWVDE